VGVVAEGQMVSGGLGMEERGYQALNGHGDFFRGRMVGGANPFAGGAVDSPASGGGEEFRGIAAFRRVVANAVEEHVTDDGDDGAFHVRGKLAGGRTVGGGGLGEGLGEEVADAEDDAGEGAGAAAFEDDTALVEQGVEAAGDDAFEQGELVGVMGVEGGAVDAGRVGDLLDGELVEVAGAEEGGEGLVEEQAGATDAGVGRLGRRGGLGHCRFQRDRGVQCRIGRGEGISGDGGRVGHGIQSTANAGNSWSNVDKRQMLCLS
jgi:hypothetical protein